MLASNFAVKKDVGYFLYKAVQVSGTCYKIVPYNVKEFTVTGMRLEHGYHLGVEDGTISIQRSIYNAGFHNYSCFVQATEYAFEVKIGISETPVFAPVVTFRRPHSDRILGNRYINNDIHYLWSWGADEDEKQRLFQYGRTGDILMNFTMNGVQCIRIPERTTGGESHLPMHVLRGYVESLVTRKETCPITMDELTLESACITPCFHVLSFEGARGWIQSHHSCPICRAACEESGLIRV